MNRNPAYQRASRLFEGHEARAFSLPDELLERRRTAIAFSEHAGAPQHAPTLPDTRSEYLIALRAAIDAGAELPDPIVLRHAAERDAASNELRRLLVDETEHAQTRLVATVQHHAETIIIDHLRPALEDTLAAGRAAADKLGDNLPTAENIVTAPDTVRKAFQTLGALATRYTTIRSAQVLVVELTTPPRLDYRNLFRELRNLPDIFPQHANPTADKPWPADTRSRFHWILTSPAEPWLPTPTEQDDAFVDRFPNAPILRGRHPGWTYREEMSA